MDVLPPGDELRAHSHTARGLDLVAREHPYLYASVAQKLQTAFDVLLELVFNPSDSQKLEVSRQIRLDHCAERRIAGMKRQRGLGVLVRKLAILRWRNPFTSNDQ